ncbi:MAG TPA: cation:dicarboxylase symporter family transporter [Puia sp.]|nr:cation:dicarboxylase symporter family transporter [Puia sp.]
MVRLPPFLRHMTFYVLIALVFAVALGFFFPNVAVKAEPLGTLFVSVIKVFIPPIIFLTISLGISGMSDLRKVGRIGIKALLYFEIVTTIALALGVTLANIAQPGHIGKAGLPVPDATKFTHQPAKGFDWLAFFRSNLTLQVLLAAVIAGIILSRLSNKGKPVFYLETATKYVFKALKIVMYLAPVGAFGGMAFTVGKYGLRTLIPLGKLMLTVYATMFVFITVVLGSILRYYGLSIWKYLRNIREEILIVLGTSSSEAALPTLMDKLQQMGCSKPVTGLVVPTGYSFNLDGTSIYLSMSTIFLAQLYGIPLSIGETLSILGILMVTSKGAAGVTGSGFIVLASTLTAVQKIPVEGLAFLLAVDKFMSEARAITNIIGNGVATLVISKSENEFVAVGSPKINDLKIS